MIENPEIHENGFFQKFSIFINLRSYLDSGVRFFSLNFFGGLKDRWMALMPLVVVEWPLKSVRAENQHVASGRPPSANMSAARPSSNF